MESTPPLMASPINIRQHQPLIQSEKGVTNKIHGMHTYPLFAITYFPQDAIETLLRNSLCGKPHSRSLQHPITLLLSTHR